jgi:branched-chain amino acid transport system ATP-binding protein
MTALLSTSDLTSGYGPVAVITDIAIEVDPGEIVGVFGANGAGKTTLLRTLAGSIRPMGGTITWREEPITRKAAWWRARNGIAHVPEGRQLFGAMSVEENLEVAGLVASQPEAALERVFSVFPKLSERRRQRSETLSGGEQQMLAIGRALMTEPSCILVDELSAGLAPIIAQELLETLDAARGEGGSVLIVEQSPHLIADLADRVYLLQQGRIVASGRFDELGGPDALADLYLGVR